MVVTDNRAILTLDNLQFSEVQRLIKTKLNSERRYLAYRIEVVERTDEEVRRRMERHFGQSL